MIRTYIGQINTATLSLDNITLKEAGGIISAKDAGVQPEKLSSLHKRSCANMMTKSWLNRTPPTYTKFLAWSPELGIFSAGGATSIDGITWTNLSYSGYFNYQYTGAVWSSSLNMFCAVASDLSYPIISSDGVTWNDSGYTDIGLTCITWSPELGLFCAIAPNANTALAARVYTSSNGLSWSFHTALPGRWEDVTWCKELNLFCAVASEGSNGVMTSPDGINWTARVVSTSSSWRSVTWSPELGLFCAVATGGSNRFITSSNGVNWTLSSSTTSIAPLSVTWSPELGLFCAVGGSGTATSPDGVSWTEKDSLDLEFVVWSPELGMFVGARTAQNGNRIVTSR